MIHKPTLLIYVKNTLTQRMNAAKEAMDAAQLSANEESKSSVGDKYETARAMAQNQRDMYQRQYEQARLELAALEKITDTPSNGKAIMGSLIETSLGWIFISASLGEIEFENTKIWVVTSKSPIGQVMLGKGERDRFQFRNREFLIKAIH